MSKLKLALMDLNNGRPNQGMRGLRDIVGRFQQDLDIEEYEVRQLNQVPGTEHQLYISSGGPGDPREGNGVWEKKWRQLLEDLWRHNQTQEEKKYVFFVCHSFQMACHHFGLCDITRRKSTSFGIYPIHKTAVGMKDPLLTGLDNPYFAVDSRDWQLINPDRSQMQHLGTQILSLEKIRTHVEYERAIMAMRFSPYMVGTQFHPEADPRGMKVHFKKQKNRDKVIENFNLEKYEKMMLHLESPEAIARTYQKVIPGFIQDAISALTTAQTH